MAMNLNRETKRRLQKQGALNAEGNPTRTQPAARPPKEERTKPREFLREVRGELRKVAWPTRNEVRNYSIVVLVTVVLFTAFIAGVDYVTGSSVLWLYHR
jgi:preprotein translocase subunit SecE